MKGELSIEETEFLMRATGYSSNEIQESKDNSPLEFDELIQNSHTFYHVHRLLDIEEDALKQKILNKSLYYFYDAGTIFFPQWQFTEQGLLIDNIDKAFALLDFDSHPVGISQFFQTSQCDLVIGDEQQAFTPIEWLKQGQPLEPLLNLVRYL